MQKETAAEPTKITKTNTKNQIKPKQNEEKLKPKQPIKTMTRAQKKKEIFTKKRKVDKQDWTCPGCKGVWKESQIDGVICRICLVCGREDFLLGIYNTWCEIIRLFH